MAIEMRDGEMRDSRIVRILMWGLVILSPLIACVVIGFATDTSLLSLDAWNSRWNDEQRHYRTVLQMHSLGQPSGVPGYDEVAALRPSYGPYCALTYAPYVLASLITGVEGHNFMYAINVAFGVLACLIVVLMLKPDVKQSILVAVLVSSEFVIARYICSGMTEASYVLYAALFAACVIVAMREGCGKARKQVIVAAFAVMVAATGFWGGMRPYILAFMLVPWALLAFCDFKLGRGWRAGLALAGLVAALAAFAYYMYASKYYATPYLSTTSFADDFFSILGNSFADLLGNNVKAVVYACKKFVHLRWRGVMMFSFAMGFVVLLVMCVCAFRKRNRREGFLFLALLLAGFLIYEANLLLYSYRQMYRMMIVVVVAYFLVIVFAETRPKIAKKMPARAVVVALSCVTCVGSLALNMSAFAFPQHSEPDGGAHDSSVQQELQEIMPQSDDQWDNTVAHLVEGGNIHLYYSLPYYLNTNNLTTAYAKHAMKTDSFKSKYVSIPAKSDFNEGMKKRYPIIFEGDNHVIYRVRDE